MYREGRRQRRGGITVILAPAPPGPARIGFVAGGRVGGAVARNRAKRRLRAATAQVGVPRGVAGIVVASPEVNDAPFERLVDWVGDALGSVPED